MAETEQSLNLEGLRAEVQQPVKTFIDTLRHRLGESLESVTVVGSSLTDDFEAGVSDINTVLVLGEYNVKTLNAIVATAPGMRKKSLAAPLLMTTDYIHRSLDVFGVEFLDFQLLHRTVLGSDPFESLTIEKRHVRLQCERELKAMLIRLRQGYIAAGKKRALVEDVLASAARGLVPLLRAMLWLKDQRRPARADEVFSAAAQTFDVRMEMPAAARNWRRQRAKIGVGEIESAFEAIYRAVDRLMRIVDQLQV